MILWYFKTSGQHKNRYTTGIALGNEFVYPIPHCDTVFENWKLKFKRTKQYLYFLVGPYLPVIKVNYSGNWPLEGLQRPTKAGKQKDNYIHIYLPDPV